MPLTIGVLKEALPGETRIALTPEITAKLQKLGVSVVMEHYAGSNSGILDSDYEDVEFTDAAGVLAKSELLFAVQPLGNDAAGGLADSSAVGHRMATALVK